TTQNPPPWSSSRPVNIVLTAAQVETAKTAYGAIKTKTGAPVYPESSPGFETGWRMPQPGGEPPAVALDSFRLALDRCVHILKSRSAREQAARTMRKISAVARDNSIALPLFS